MQLRRRLTPPGRTEVSLADIAVVPASAPTAAAASDGSADAFAGRTANGVMTVAVAVKGDKAEAYVCGGKIEAWLSGSVSNGALSLKSKSGRTVLTGTVGSTGVEGTVTIDGVESAYSAAATDVATAAGNGRADVGKVVSRLGGVG